MCHLIITIIKVQFSFIGRENKTMIYFNYRRVKLNKHCDDNERFFPCQTGPQPVRVNAKHLPTIKSTC